MLKRSFVALLGVAVLALPGAALAQSVTGQVTDNTGGVLPGVTVEASSEALIEGSRIAITDGQGRYNIVALAVGTYSVAFTLPGFSTTLVEEVGIEGQAALTVDAIMEVGALEETVTVSGAAPQVDVQTTATAEVLDREMLDAIPTGRNLQSTAQLIPGVKMNRPEVGLTTAAQQTYMSVHGMSNRQTTVRVDGQLVMSSGGDGAVQNYNNQLAAAEMVYDTAGINAETSAGGVRVSMIPREGGNTFSGQQYIGFADGALQSDNLSQRFQQRGGTSVESIDYTYDLNTAFGGPIVRDRLWFFGSFRRFSINVPVTNSFYQNNSGTTARYFNPSPVKLDGKDGRELMPGINDDRITSGLLRITAQVSDTNKFTAYLDRIIKQRFHDYDARVDVGTASRHHGSPIYYVGSAKWTSTLSNRLLAEIGYSSTIENWSNVDQESEAPYGPGASLKPGGTHTQPLPAGLTTCVATPCYSNDLNQYNYNNTGAPHPWYQNSLRRDTAQNFADRYHWGDRHAYVERFNVNASLSYVTGSHNLKFGVMDSFGPFRLIDMENGSLRQRYRDGVPYQIGRSNQPVDYSLGYNDFSLYAQDTWTVDRLTLNLGLRWEAVTGTVDPTNRLTNTRWTNATTFPGQTGIPDWTDIAPRLGFAYDLFGDATTALKASWGRYNASVTHSLASRMATGTGQRESLSWFDCALNSSNTCASRGELTALGLDPAIAYGTRQDQYVKGAAGTTGHQMYGGTNGDDFVQDWEVSPGNTEFGGARSTARIDPNGIDRPWVAMSNVGIERELTRGLSMSFNWYRRDSYGALLEVNRALSLSDWTRFDIPNPCAGSGGTAASGFPCSTRGIAGQATLPVYAKTEAAQSFVPDNVYTNTNADMGYSEAYNGFEWGFNGRMDNGISFFGAYTFERNILERCDSQDNPNELLFCNASDYGVPWLHELKLSGSVPLPGGMSISGTFQTYTPREVLATTSYAGDSASGLNGGGGLWGSLLRMGNVSHNVQAKDYPADVPFTGNQIIPLMPGGSTFLDRLNQFDVSVRKTMNLSDRIRADVQMDVYNLLNQTPILEATNRFGSSLGNPLRSIQGRFLQFATNIYW